MNRLPSHCRSRVAVSRDPHPQRNRLALDHWRDEPLDEPNACPDCGAVRRRDCDCINWENQ